MYCWFLFCESAIKHKRPVKSAAMTSEEDVNNSLQFLLQRLTVGYLYSVSPNDPPLCLKADISRRN